MIIKLLSLVVLMALVTSGCENIVDKKSDIERPGANGNRIIHTAAISGDDVVIQQLIGFNADINAKNNDGHTPLMLAVKNSHLKSVSLLLDRKADVNLIDKNNRTALFYALQNYYELTTRFTISEESPNFGLDWRVGDQQISKKLIANGAYIEPRKSEDQNNISADKDNRFNCSVEKIKIYQLEMPCNEHINISYSSNNSQQARVVNSIYKSCTETKQKLIQSLSQDFQDNCAKLNL